MGAVENWVIGKSGLAPTSSFAKALGSFPPLVDN